MPLLFFAVALGLTVLAHTAPFPFLIDAMAPGRVFWEMPARSGPPTVYLTFDDGPNPEATPALLDVLERAQARATFFLIDRHVHEGTAGIVRRAFEEGHGVALHSDSRRLMLLPPRELGRTLVAAAEKIERLTGYRPCRAFRPHAGWRGGQMMAGLAQFDYALVGWGWMLWDWNWFRDRTADSIVRRVGGRISAGDIVVLHDGHHEDPSADRTYTVDATARLIPLLRERGFELGTICEAIEDL